MKPVIAVLALLFVQECGLFTPSIHSMPIAGEDPDAGFPVLGINGITCQPELIERDAGLVTLPWDGGELPLLDSGIRQFNYELPQCDMAALRATTLQSPGVGLGIDAPSPELRSAANLMVGEWTGTRTTPWDGEHPVTLIFFQSGHYSLATGDCTLPNYYGQMCADHSLSWRLDTGNDVQAEGEMRFDYHMGAPTGVMWMKQVRVRQSELSFNLWHREAGPIEYRLVRDTTSSCAGKNVIACP